MRNFENINWRRSSFDAFFKLKRQAFVCLLLLEKPTKTTMLTPYQTRTLKTRTAVLIISLLTWPNGQFKQIIVFKSLILLIDQIYRKKTMIKSLDKPSTKHSILRMPRSQKAYLIGKVILFHLDVRKTKSNQNKIGKLAESWIGLRLNHMESRRRCPKMTWLASRSRLKMPVEFKKCRLLL